MLKSRVSGVQIDVDPVFQTPKFIRSGVGFSHRARRAGRAVSAASVQGFSPNDPYLRSKLF